MPINLVPYHPGETLVNLDVTRRELTELPLAFARRAADIDTAQGGRNLVRQWPGTKTFTLMPIQEGTDFAETANYEFLKLRLSDWNCDTNYFAEYPEGRRHDINGGNPYDFFITAKVPQDQIPQGFPFLATGDQSFLLANLQPVAVATTLLLASANLESDHTVIALSSVAVYPYNQGYFLRFWIEGEPSFKRAALLVFYFGEFALRLNSNGVAELQQTGDGAQTYKLVKTFQWTDADSVHSKHHIVQIYPHCRNKIEIETQDEEPALSGIFDIGVTRFPKRGCVYEWPGELIYQPDGVTPLITGAAPIYLSISREFKPHFQVSLLGFVNGMQPDGSGQAYLFDGAIDLHAFPGIPIGVGVDGDANGGGLAWQLIDPTTLQPWQPNTPTCNLVQLALAFQGTADIGGGLVSSRSPEFYGYAIEKGAAFQIIARNTVTLPPTSSRIDTGEKPESERLTVTLDNSAFQADMFRERGNIPLTLVDGLSGLTLFEGTGMSVEAGEAVKPAPQLTIEACGMVDKLRRKHFTDLAPNFGKDPSDPNQQGYFWTTVVKWCFAIGGFDPDTQVLIEDGNLYDFRLWDDGSGGGTTSSGSHGDGHVSESGQLAPRWKPRFDSTPDDYLEMLLGWIGWHHQWSVIDHRWHVYKRPIPTNGRDQAHIRPKASFWDNLQNAQNDTTGLPIYLHSKARTRTTRPEFTTVIASAILNEAHILTRAELQAALQQEIAGDSNPSDPLIKTTPRNVSCAYDNKAGYANPFNQPPNTAHSDYLGEPCTRWFTIAAPSRESLWWWTRMVGYDLTHGYVWKDFEADWGDALTVGLRKWDTVFYNGRLAFIDRVEADWSRDGNRRAQYGVSIAHLTHNGFLDAPPPR